MHVNVDINDFAANRRLSIWFGFCWMQNDGKVLNRTWKVEKEKKCRRTAKTAITIRRLVDGMHQFRHCPFAGDSCKQNQLLERKKRNGKFVRSKFNWPFSLLKSAQMSSDDDGERDANEKKKCQTNSRTSEFVGKVNSCSKHICLHYNSSISTAKQRIIALASTVRNTIMDGTILAYISFGIFTACAESGVCRAWHIIECKINGKSEPTASEWCSRRRWDIRSISHTHTNIQPNYRKSYVLEFRERAARDFRFGDPIHGRDATHTHSHEFTSQPHGITFRFPASDFPHEFDANGAHAVMHFHVCCTSSIYAIPLFCKFYSLLSFQSVFISSTSFLCAVVSRCVCSFFFSSIFSVVLLLPFIFVWVPVAVVFPTCAVQFGWQLFVDCDALQ